jgi:hypothetical protein
MIVRFYVHKPIDIGTLRGLAATRLLGLQCRIGSDAAIRHEVNQLGMQWYFLGAMSDKMLQAARHTQSPVIARQLQIMLGPELYQQAVVAPSSGDRKAGAVKPLFPASHPPDYARVQAIEEALAGLKGDGEKPRRVVEAAAKTGAASETPISAPTRDTCEVFISFTFGRSAPPSNCQYSTADASAAGLALGLVNPHLSPR